MVRKKPPVVGQFKATQIRPGLRIGHLYVVQKGKDDLKALGPQRRRWIVDCDCGKRMTIKQMYLTRAQPKTSCGCANKGLRTIHKDVYSCWSMMRTRCNDPKHVAYIHYGGRGIKVCPEWDDPETGFEAFLEHIGPRPSMGHSIDRIDNDLGYFPGNVRWATAVEQRANQRPRKG